MDNSKSTEHTEASGSTGVVVASNPRSLFGGNKKVLFIAIAVAIVGIVVAVIWLTNNARSSNYATQQQQLQQNLASDQRQMYNAGIINVSTQLIDGQKAGHFRIDSKTLSQYYMYRGGARVNNKQYSLAMQDYQEALKLDGSAKEGALQGEVLAGYRAGERQQLIPLLQQLVTISSAPGHDPIRGNAQEYQYDIQAIQNNKPADL